MSNLRSRSAVRSPFWLVAAMAFILIATNVLGWMYPNMSIIQGVVLGVLLVPVAVGFGFVAVWAFCGPPSRPWRDR